MLDKLKDIMRDAPVCTIHPVPVETEVPETWRALDGTSFDPKEFKDFHRLLMAKFAHPETGRLLSKWWYDFQGNRTRFPKIPSSEVYRSAFGPTAKGETELKLIIKVNNV